MNQEDSLITLGYISGVHGIEGWVKVYSYTDPRAAILEYQPWLIGAGHRPVSIRDGRRQGKILVASLPGIDSPEQARVLVGEEIAIRRDQLPATQENQYYWADLVGMRVRTVVGDVLGVVQSMLDTAAHDVMVVEGERERLIPFVPGRYVTNVDLEAGEIEVDWELDD